MNDSSVSAGGRAGGVHPIALAVLAASIAVVIYGLLKHASALFDQPLWPRMDGFGILALSALVVVVAAAGRLLAPSMRRAVFVVVVVVAGAAVFGILVTVATLYILISCAAMGDLLISRLQEDRTHVDRLSLAALTGLALYASMVGIMAHLPVNSPLVYVPLLAVPIVVNRRAVARHLRFIAGREAGTVDETSRVGYAVGALLVLVLVLHAVRAALPETGGDGMGMHLAIASQMASDHQWAFDYRNFEWALYPMGSEWIMSLGWVLGGEGAAKALHYGVFILLALQLRSQAQRVCPRVGADVAAALFASAGIAFGVTANVYTELALTAFVVAAFGLVVFPRRWTVTSMIVIGILSGACLLTKVTAVYMLLPLLIVLVVRVARAEGSRRATRLAGIAVATAAAVSFVPYAYAVFRTGNPVYPLYASVFGAGEDETLMDPRWIGHFSWKLPYTMTFITDQYCEVFKGTLGFQYLALLPFGAVLGIMRRRWAVLLALVVAAPSALALLYTMQYVRYVFPMMGIAMICIAGAFIALESPSRLVRGTVLAGGIALCVLNLALMLGGAWNLPGFGMRALVSDSARDVFVSQQAPQRELNDIVNALDGRDARVAYVGPAFWAGLEGEAYLAMGYNPDFMEDFYAARSTAAMRGVIQSRHIGYLIAPQTSIDAMPPLVGLLKTDGRLLKNVNGTALYALGEAASPER